MTAHPPKHIPESARQDKDAIPFENYKSLAGAIVARSVEDFVIINIFYRDDLSGRFDYIYNKTANHNYKRWKTLVDNHADKKREARKVLKANGSQIEFMDQQIKSLKTEKMIADEKIKIIDSKLKLWNTGNRKKSLKKQAVAELSKERAKHEDVSRTATEKIESLSAKQSNLRKEVSLAKGRLKSYREVEEIDKREFHPSYHHRLAMERAQSEEKNLLRWFSSPLFEAISPMSAEVVLDNTDKAVHGRMIDRAVKFIYILPTRSERGEGNNSYDKKRKKKG